MVFSPKPSRRRPLKPTKSVPPLRKAQLASLTSRGSWPSRLRPGQPYLTSSPRKTLTSGEPPLSEHHHTLAPQSRRARPHRGRPRAPIPEPSRTRGSPEQQPACCRGAIAATDAHGEAPHPPLRRRRGSLDALPHRRPRHLPLRFPGRSRARGRLPRALARLPRLGRVAQPARTLPPHPPRRAEVSASNPGISP